MKKRIAVLAVFVLLVVLAACGEKPKSDDAAKTSVTIYASTEEIYDVTRAIAGDHVEVKNLMPGIVDAHHWEPTSDLIRSLNESQALFLNGAGFEPWIESLKNSLDDTVQVVDLSEGVDIIEIEDEHGHDHEEEEEHEEHDHGGKDPHYWLSPAAVKVQAKNIVKALSSILPEEKKTFEDNLSKVEERLTKLEKDYGEKLKPYSGRALVVPHEAFTYLAEAFDLKQIAVENVFSEGEPDAKRLGEIVDEVKEEGTHVVFYDAYGDSKVADTIAEAIGGSVMPLYTLESISEDDRKNGEDYFTLMQKNLETIIQAMEE